MRKLAIAEQRHHSVEEVAEALLKSHGVVLAAARMLHMSRQGVEKRIKESTTLQEVKAQSRESIVDMAETGLVKAIRDQDAWAIQFTLRTLGRDRGYADRKEITGAEGGPIEVRSVDYRQAVAPMLSDE